MTNTAKSNTEPVGPTPAESVKPTEAAGIPKPAEKFSLDLFKSTRDPELPGILLTTLPHYKIADAKDYVRLHPDEQNCWSNELCFVNVPIKGAKGEALHLIAEGIAVKYLPSARILRFRLALASKPEDVFFLCHVPTRNLDNAFNEKAVEACEMAKTIWLEVVSRKPEGIEGYLIKPASDQKAFYEPNWPEQSLNELIMTSFTNRLITTEDHPGLLRLRGMKQVLK
jgi:hypothetical protein